MKRREKTPVVSKCSETRVDRQAVEEDDRRGSDSATDILQGTVAITKNYCEGLRARTTATKTLRGRPKQQAGPTC